MTREITFGRATQEAMAEAMRRDPCVIVMGEDIHWGGAFGQFQGLYDEFGPERVIDMPISEALIISAAVGAAITGLRPVVSISFVEFTMGAMDEIVNQAAKIRYMSGGQCEVPLVLRASDGVLYSSGAQHSESLEGLFAHIPGLKIVAPSTPEDAKGLLTAAIAERGPVIYLENKAIGRSKGPVPEGEYTTPMGQAIVRRPGRHATVIAYSVMAVRAAEAAELLAREGIEVELIDLRTVVPVDFDTVAASVRKTGRVVVCHEACRTGGFGAELASRISEELFDHLDAPVVRVGARDTPIPFSPPLERAVIPQMEDVMAAVRRTLGR